MKKALSIVLAFLVSLMPILGCAESENKIAELTDLLIKLFKDWEPETDYPAPKSCNELVQMHISVKAMSLAFCLEMVRDAFLKADGKTLSEFVYDKENFDKSMSLVLITDDNGFLNFEGEKLLCGDNDEAFGCCLRIILPATYLQEKLAGRELALAYNKYAIDAKWYEDMLNIILFTELLLGGRCYLPENEKEYNNYKTFFLDGVS